VHLLYRSGNPLGQSVGRWMHISWNGWSETDSRTPASAVTTCVITYTYDAASRLTNVGDVSYTWDARGNLTSDGTFALHTHTTPPDGWCGRKASLPRWCTPTSPMACVWRNPWNLADPLSKDVTEFA
jgi:hypothetical protein